MTDLAEDEIVTGSPDKGPAISIAMEQVLLNGLRQLTHVTEGAAAMRLFVIPAKSVSLG
jgi:hypothetical protein